MKQFLRLRNTRYQIRYPISRIHPPKYQILSNIDFQASKSCTPNSPEHLRLQIKISIFPSPSLGQANPSHAQAYPSHAHMLTAPLPATRRFPQFFPQTIPTQLLQLVRSFISSAAGSQSFVISSALTAPAGACCDFDISLIAAFLLRKPPNAPGPRRVYNIYHKVLCLQYISKLTVFTIKPNAVFIFVSST